LGKIIRGPWGNLPPETISKVSSTSTFKVMNYFSCLERQENAFKSNVYVILYVINLDYNRCFLVPGTREEVEYQLNVRKDRPEEIEKIKASLGWYK
jgi:hypothetical protein